LPKNSAQDGPVSVATPTPAPVAPVNAPLTPYSDAAAFNSGFTWETAPGVPTIVTDLTGDTIRDNPVLPYGLNEPGTVTWQLDSGASLDVSDGIITYAFFDFQHALGLNNNPDFGEGKGYVPFTEAQKDAARIAIQNWDDLIAPDFVEATSTPGASGWAHRGDVDIYLANTSTGPAQAWAYYPGYSRQYERVASDVWIADPDYNSSNGQLDPGQYGLLTLNHELGHSIGLAHPGSYDYGDDNDGDGQPDPISYTGDAQYFQDSMQFTIMSYFDSYETGAQPIDWNVMRFIYASTPMVDDVYVAQQKYGVEINTRTGDTTYGFNSTADVTNEAMKFHTNEMATIFTIWDAAGNDTLDLSGYYTNSVIDLREGGYSSAGGYGAYDPTLVGTTPTLAEINANNADAGLGARTERLFKIYFEGNYSDTNPDGTTTLVNEGQSWKDITGTTDDYLMEQNIGIAYGAIIENAIGGEGNDRINGNQVDNSFTGNGGADTFIFANYTGSVPDPESPTGYSDIVDNSTDTIVDFETGVDKIDLSFWDGLDASRVQFTTETDTLIVDTNLNGSFSDASDVTIIVHGSDVAAGDYIFG